MADTLSKLLNDLLCASSSAELSRCLHEILSYTQKQDSNCWRELVYAITCSIRDDARKRIDTILCYPNAAPYGVVTGPVADIIYIAHELGPAAASEPRWTLAKLAFYAEMLASADEEPIVDVDVPLDVFRYCTSTFPGIKGLLMVIPSCSINCAAETYEVKDRVVLALNRSNTGRDYLADFAYESCALSIAMEPIPSDSMELLIKTCGKGVERIREEDRLGQYLEWIKAGLSYEGPHKEEMLSSGTRTAEEDEKAKEWHEFLLKK